MYQRALGSGVPCSRAAEIIPTIAGHGFQYVRFTSFHELTDVQLQAVRTQCEEAGLTPFSAHAPGQFLPEDPNQLETRLAFHRRVLDQVAQLGADRVTFHLASVENVRDSETEAYVARIGEETFKEMNIHTVRTLAQYAQQYNISIALENRDQGQVADYCRTIDTLNGWIDAVGEPNVGITLDTGHAHTHGDLHCGEMIREAGLRLIETHFHDNYGRLCDGKIWGNGVVNDLHRPPGIGTIDWLDVVDALVEIDYPYPIMFEVGMHTDEDELGRLLMLTRENWRLILEAHRYVRDRLAH